MQNRGKNAPVLTFLHPLQSMPNYEPYLSSHTSLMLSWVVLPLLQASSYALPGPIRTSLPAQMPCVST